MKRIIIYYSISSNPLNEITFMGEFNDKDEAINQLYNYHKNADIHKIVEIDKPKRLM